ncbi:DUF1146 family protein [Ligilactobacillus faecis]|uniref:DUF1146 family protein n=2 Tax=Ligilactobacillus faecis TaxID=762833 RepID=A0ABV4DQT1_9LACO
MQYVGIMSLLTIISHFLFIALAFVGIQSLRLDRYIVLKDQRPLKLVIVMLSVTIGYSCSSFFLSFMDSVVHLSYLV